MHVRKAVALVALVALAGGCGSGAASQPVAVQPVPAASAAPGGLPALPEAVTQPRGRVAADAYWNEARLASLEVAKAAFVPAPEQAASVGVPAGDPAAPAPSDSIVESPQPATQPAPRPVAAPAPAPQPAPTDQPAPQPTAEPTPAPAPETQPETRRERRFIRELRRIDQALQDGTMTIDEAVAELEEMQKWPGLTPEQQEILEVNIAFLTDIIRERDRNRLDKP